jgi:hypothetical protein
MNIGNLVYGTGINDVVGAGNLGIATTTPDANHTVTIKNSLLVNTAGAGYTGTIGFGTATSDGVEATTNVVGIQCYNQPNLYLAKPAGYTSPDFTAFYNKGQKLGAIGTDGTNMYQIAGSGTTPLMFYGANQKVGIATTTPDANHTVTVKNSLLVNTSGAGYTGIIGYGTATSDGVEATQNVVGIQCGNQPNLYLGKPSGYGNADYTAFYSNGQKLGSIATDGTNVYQTVGGGAGNSLVFYGANQRVGIGTTTPGAKLDVGGDALVNGLTVGRGAGNNLNNAVLGNNALSINTSGGSNTAVGLSVLVSNTTGSNNTGVGAGALAGTIGSNNTGVGVAVFGVSTTGSNNTALGYNAGTNQISGDNNTMIGNGANVPNSSGSNQIRMGNAAITYAGIQVDWTITSDRRYKTNIATTPLGLEFIKELRPVVYNRYINNNTSFDTKNEYGFIAQDVKELLDKRGITSQSGLLFYDQGTDRYSLRYNDFIPILTKALQEETAKTESLQAQMESMKKDYQAQINELKAAIEALKSK